MTTHSRGLKMGHLPIVNQKTLPDMIHSGYISVRGDLKKLMIKTIADILADVLATREGDPVFPWIVQGPTGENLGFKYEFEVEGPPVFVEGEEYPVKVPLRPRGLEYSNALTENKAVDLWHRRLLWNIIGKKSLGRGRSITHQLPMEDKRMKTMLEQMNPDDARQIAIGSHRVQGTPITINPRQDKWDTTVKDRLNSVSPRDRIALLDIFGIPWRRGSRFNFEKALEAWIMQNIDRKEGMEFRQEVLEKDLSLEWFGNYLSYGVSGSNIDLVILQDADTPIVTVVELKVGHLSQNAFKRAADQVLEYSAFIKRAFEAFGFDANLQNVVISHSGSRCQGASRVRGASNEVGWVEYEIDNSGKVHFGKML